jgi:hypothetical protein
MKVFEDEKLINELKNFKEDVLYLCNKFKVYKK